MSSSNILIHIDSDCVYLFSGYPQFHIRDQKIIESRGKINKVALRKSISQLLDCYYNFCATSKVPVIGLWGSSVFITVGTSCIKYECRTFNSFDSIKDYCEQTNLQIKPEYHYLPDEDVFCDGSTAELSDALQGEGCGAGGSGADVNGEAGSVSASKSGLGVEPGGRFLNRDLSVVSGYAKSVFGGRSNVDFGKKIAEISKKRIGALEMQDFSHAKTMESRGEGENLEQRVSMKLESDKLLESKKKKNKITPPNPENAVFSGDDTRYIIRYDMHNFVETQARIGLSIFAGRPLEDIVEACSKLELDIQGISSKWEFIAKKLLPQSAKSAFVIEVGICHVTIARYVGRHLDSVEHLDSVNLDMAIKQVSGKLGVTTEQAYRLVKYYALIPSEVERLKAIQARDKKDLDINQFLTQEYFDVLDAVIIKFSRQVLDTVKNQIVKQDFNPEQIYFLQSHCFMGDRTRIHQAQKNIDLKFLSFEDGVCEEIKSHVGQVNVCGGALLAPGPLNSLDLSEQDEVIVQVDFEEILGLDEVHARRMDRKSRLQVQSSHNYDEYGQGIVDAVFFIFKKLFLLK